MLSSATFRTLASGTLVLGLAALAFVLARNPPAARPDLGTRGLKRRRALAKNAGFALIEPLVRFVAGWIARIPMGARRSRINALVVHAGTPLGLSPDEFLALSFLGGLFFLLMGVALDALAQMGLLVAIFLGALGSFLPYVIISGDVDRRFLEINRSLPIATDVMALCMGAGLDFPGALRQVLDKSRKDALHEELSRVYQELELGHTRKQALEALADRAPTEAMRDFVGAVVQAEEKGTPLAEVLGIQANMQRMRRSVNAEEAAAKAGVKMMIPLTLIFASILTLLLGPFIINAMQSGW